MTDTTDTTSEPTVATDTTSEPIADATDTASEPTATTDRPPETGALTVLWALWKMARPSHLALITLVYAMGVGIALATTTAGLAVETVVGGLLVVLFVAASVHYANEYADVETDALTDRTPFSGGSGALPATGLDPWLALLAGLVTLVGGGITLLAAPPLSPAALALLAVIVVLGWQYSVAPVKLAWRGFGEVTNALLGGVILPLYGYTVVTGRLPLEVMLWVLPFGVLVFLNLLDTQWPDRRADGAVGKDTLAVQWSAARLQRTYHVGIATLVGSLALAFAIGMPLVVAVAHLVVAPLVLLGSTWYTNRRTPIASVFAMVLAAGTTSTAWWWLALG